MSDTAEQLSQLSTVTCIPVRFSRYKNTVKIIGCNKHEAQTLRPSPDTPTASFWTDPPEPFIFFFKLDYH